MCGSFVSTQTLQFWQLLAYPDEYFSFSTLSLFRFIRIDLGAVSLQAQLKSFAFQMVWTWGTFGLLCTKFCATEHATQKLPECVQEQKLAHNCGAGFDPNLWLSRLFVVPWVQNYLWYVNMPILNILGFSGRKIQNTRSSKFGHGFCKQNLYWPQKAPRFQQLSNLVAWLPSQILFIVLLQLMFASVGDENMFWVKSAKNKSVAQLEKKEEICSFPM